MRIYDEITIDMNPESDTYKEVLSEDSYEYKGNVALCGGLVHWGKSAGDVNLRPTKGTGRAGLLALGLPQYGGGEGYGLPTTIPSSGPHAALGMQAGGETIGRPEPGAATPWTGEPVTPSLYEGKGLAGFLNIGRKRLSDPGYAAEEAVTGTAEGGPFKEWYGDPGTAEDPAAATGYMKAGVVDPIQSIREKGFVSAEELGLPAATLTQYGDFLPTGGGVTTDFPLIAKGDVSGVSSLRHQLELDIKAEQDEQARLDELLLGGEEERDLALDEAAKLRLKAIRGDLSQHEARQAGLARTGMARSGPAERGVEIQEEAFKGSLGDIAGRKRGALKKFRETKAGWEGEKTTAEELLEEQKRGFGEEVGNVLELGAEQAGKLMGGLQDIAGAHLGYGDWLTEQTKRPTSGPWAPEHLQEIREYGGMTGETGYAAPEGGYFQEARDLPIWRAGERDVNIVNAFADYIKTLEDPGALASNVEAAGE